MRILPGLLLAIGILLPVPAAQAIDMPVGFGDVLALEASAPDRTVRYGNASSQTASLWLPPDDGAARAVIVLVHGGCWLSAYSAPHSYPLAAQLAVDGYAVWVPEYRRVGERGGGWPGTAADLVRALDMLATLEQPGLTLARTVLLGHSAGGHLALWLAGRDPTLPRPPLRVVAAIGLAPITDLDAYARGGNSCEAVTPVFMGAGPDDAPARYRQASPAQRPLRVPTYLLRGGADPIVGARQVDAMPGAQHRHLEAAGHFDWIHPQTPAYTLLLRTLDEALADNPMGERTQ